MPPRSLAAFLAAGRAALAAPAGQRATPLTLVVGNESADLDSLCSAVLLAYFRSHTPPHSASLHVPLAHLTRAELRLRPELQAALAGPRNGGDGSGGGGLPIDSLITLSELPADLAAADTRWLLVDHNALTGDLGARFGDRVVGCIDHHVDEGVVPPPDAARGLGPRIIDHCGSCASLVVDHVRDTWRRLARDDPDVATDRVLARIALAAVLVDTSSLRSASKTVDVDRRAVAWAEAVLGHTTPAADVAAAVSANPADLVLAAPADAAYAADAAAYDRAAFYADLSRLKDDISSFSYSDILRKDYKQWTELPASSPAASALTLGMSTVVQGMGYLLDTIGDADALVSALRAYARERHLDIAAIMTVQHDAGGFARQLLLWAFSPPAAAAARAFVDANRDRLGLTPWRDGCLDSTDDADGRGEWRTCWTQGRTEFSRKQVAPYLREAMRSS